MLSPGCFLDDLGAVGFWIVFAVILCVVGFLVENVPKVWRALCDWADDWWSEF